MTGQRQPMSWENRRMELRAACGTVRRFLVEWDPAGLAATVPADGYDRLADLVIGRLTAGADTAALGELLRQDLRLHFGVRFTTLTTSDIAAELIAWWSRLTPAQRRHKPDSSPLTVQSHVGGGFDLEATPAPPVVDEYAHLWDGTDPGWVIIADSSESDPGGLPFNQRTRMALLICEDDELAEAVLRAMRSHGVPVVTADSVSKATVDGSWFPAGA